MFILLATLRKQSPGPRPERQRAAPSAGVSSPLLHPRFPGATSSFCTTHPRATDSPGTSSQTSGKFAVKPTGGGGRNRGGQRPTEAGEPAAGEGGFAAAGREAGGVGSWDQGTEFALPLRGKSSNQKHPLFNSTFCPGIKGEDMGPRIPQTSIRPALWLPDLIPTSSRLCWPRLLLVPSPHPTSRQVP